jgi:hypothetical protein
VRITSPSCQAQGEKQRAILPDLLHSLSQPITALHCGLELSLLRDERPEGFRRSLKAALENVARIRECFLRVSEIVEAEASGDISAPVRADRLLRRVWEETLPLAEGADVQIQPICEPVLIRGNEEKLAWAFVCLIESILPSCSSGDIIELWTVLNRSFLEVFLLPSHAAESCAPAQPTGPPPRSRLDVVRRYFEAAGGQLVPANDSSGVRPGSVKLPLFSC